jgi:surface antigen
MSEVVGIVDHSRHRSWVWRALSVILIVSAWIMTGVVAGTSQAQASQTDCMSYAYGCTPNYSGGNASNTWAWKYYGGSYAATPTGYHNCTLYVAWRLAQNGMGDPGGSWGNAVSWASSIGGGNHTPALGSIAWWGSEQGGGFGHVAYVEQVNGGNVYVRADNYSSSGGYTTAGWIAASSVDLFLHPHDIGGLPDGMFVSYQGAVYRIAGGAPIYVSTWSAFGGPQPTANLTDQQWASLPQFPADGTFVNGAQRGEVYRIAGGAPTYVSTWSAFGGPQPTTTIDIAAIDNAGAGSVWNHLNYRPADGTFVNGAQTGKVYEVNGGTPTYISDWSQVGGPQPTVPIDQTAIDNGGAGGIWNHLLAPQ